MTEASADVAALVLDAPCLSQFARADRLDVLRDLLIGRECWTTETVLAELNQGVVGHPLLGNVSGQEWLHVARLDRDALWPEPWPGRAAKHCDSDLFVSNIYLRSRAELIALR